ncbi:MAG: hypothetical protein RLZZ602_1634 [Pseudomonadota bacterium]|jgi:hypothetical protein
MSKVVSLPVADHAVQELVEKMIDLAYQHEHRVSLAAAIGALEIAKKVLLDAHVDMGEE